MMVPWWDEGQHERVCLFWFLLPTQRSVHSGGGVSVTGEEIDVYYTVS